METADNLGTSVSISDCKTTHDKIDNKTNFVNACGSTSVTNRYGTSNTSNSLSGTNSSRKCIVEKDVPWKSENKTASNNDVKTVPSTKCLSKKGTKRRKIEKNDKLVNSRVEEEKANQLYLENILENILFEKQKEFLRSPEVIDILQNLADDQL